MGRLGRCAILLLLGFPLGCTSSREYLAEAPKTLLTWSLAERRAPQEPEQAEGETPPREEEPLASDRPDFTEASSTVGRGRVQLEAGYTLVRDRAGGVTTTSHSYPEALLRVGALANWLEFRVGQNLGNVRSGSADGVFSSAGAEDLYLGIKFGLAEQMGVLPETALVVQAQVPTGHHDFSAGRVLPGLNLLYGWDVIEDLLTFAGSSQANRAIDEAAHGYVELAQSLTVGYTLTKQLGAYTEWFAFFPAGAVSPGVVAQHYVNAGFTYRLTPNVQFDIRSGLGLSRAADDFFAGSGFAVRF